MRKLPVLFLVVLVNSGPGLLGAAVEAGETDVVPATPGPPDLPTLWNLALAHNPLLHEAEADIEAARGRWIQAGKYPNPRFAYQESLLGTAQNPAGDLTLEVTQEILTGGKRRLDLAIARRGTDLAGIALLGRQFAILTRLRRYHAEWIGWAYTLRVGADTVAALEEGVRITRRQVEEAKIRPRTDLIRLEAVLAEARLTQDRARLSLETAWRQLAAEVGVPTLPMPPLPDHPIGPVRPWGDDAVLRRVLAVHTDLRQAALDTDRARLEVARARAEAVPNVTIGGGYSANYPENEHGAVVAVEVPLPLWDRKQGRIHEAQARLCKARAAEHSVALRLTQDTTAALDRYESARQRVDRLTRAIIPPLAESLTLIRRGYQTAAAGITFADVLLAEQNLGAARLRLAEAWRDLGLAVADLEGLMQLGIGEELGPAPATPHCPLTPEARS